MYTYKDNNYLVTDDMLLLSIDPKSGTIPTDIDGGHPITRIGSGAYYQHNFSRLVIPPTIEVIGEKAFGCCHLLSEVYLSNPNITIEKDAFDDHRIKRLTMHVSHEQYNHLLLTSRFCGNQKHLVGADCFDAGINQMLNDAFHIHLPHIPEEIPILFHAQPDERIKLFQNVDCYDFRGKHKIISENDAFVEWILSPNHYIPSLHEESSNDWLLRMNNKVDIQTTDLFEFSDEDVKYTDGGVDVTLHVLKRLFYWQSGQKVRYKGKMYYIYQRNYLTSIPYFKDRPPFPLREEIAVFFGGELLTDYQLSEAVYAKYRLAASL